jgi:hypothetical protein
MEQVLLHRWNFGGVDKVTGSVECSGSVACVVDARKPWKGWIWSDAGRIGEFLYFCEV